MKPHPCAELVARCFDARTTLHFAHLTTRSYSEHMALGELYNALGEAADNFAECYMGVDGVFKNFPAITPDPQATPLEYLTDLHDWFTKNRDRCADGSTELANLIDELLAVIDRGFYKLRFLK